MMNVEEKTAVPDNHTFHFVLKACAYTTDPQSENVYKFVNEIEKLESIGYLPDYLGAPMVDEINDGKL